jgi:hypothetical protein
MIYDDGSDYLSLPSELIDIDIDRQTDTDI